MVVLKNDDGRVDTIDAGDSLETGVVGSYGGELDYCGTFERVGGSYENQVLASGLYGAGAGRPLFDNFEGGGAGVHCSGGKQKEMKSRKKHKPDDHTQDYGDMGFEDGGSSVDMYGGFDQGDDELQEYCGSNVESDSGGKEKEMKRRKKAKPDDRNQDYEDMSFEHGGESVDRYGEIDQVDGELEAQGGRDVDRDSGRQRTIKRRVKFEPDGGTKDYGNMDFEDDGGRVDRYGEGYEGDKNLQGHGERDVESGGRKQKEMKRRRKSKPDERTQDYGDMVWKML